MCDRTKPNLDSTHELRGCARTVRSSSKASNPTFQPLIGSQEPTPEVLVPVIKLLHQRLAVYHVCVRPGSEF